MNQFFYTREQDIDGKVKKFRDSFNIEKCIRSVTEKDGTVIVILDDFNERVQSVPDINPKTGKSMGTKNVRHTVQSEIVLSKADGERFFKLTNIE